MLKSMTAHGRASLNAEAGHFIVEIQSVNRKFLEIHVSLPHELSYFDAEIKKWLHPFIGRGQVSVKVSASFEGKAPFVVVPNLALARQLKAAWEQIAIELGIGKKEVDLSLLANTENLLGFEENRQDEEAYRQALKQVVDEALANFTHMKLQEGLALQADFTKRLDKIRKDMQYIEQRAPYATAKYREKLLARLEELLPGYTENEERVLREIALFAEKIDITEEITRFFCHLIRLEDLIQTEQGSIGKTIEFVLQELNREINTIGSKSSDIEIARLVIDVKSELERLREQIQNIE